ncbi:MAG: hypothetical protein M3290_05605 [Actinomycetota bacterium]|nr:hypothetical protein [Actinomycetota bacterium]
MDPQRFDPDLLDPIDPFEIDDGNLPHLGRWEGITPDDLLEAWRGEPRLFLSPEGYPADWDLVSEVASVGTIVVPLMRAKSGDASKARPITVFRANLRTQARYLTQL